MNATRRRRDRSGAKGSLSQDAGETDRQEDHTHGGVEGGQGSQVAGPRGRRPEGQQAAAQVATEGGARDRPERVQLLEDRVAVVGHGRKITDRGLSRLAVRKLCSALRVSPRRACTRASVNHTFQFVGSACVAL
jgi:hypothetical protein